MNVRLVVAAVLVTVVGSAAVPALAATTSPEGRQINVCVLGPSPQAPNQEGYCVGVYVPFPR